MFEYPRVIQSLWPFINCRALEAAVRKKNLQFQYFPRQELLQTENFLLLELGREKMTE